MRLQDKVALITGSGSGFGRHCARRFVREGASVVISDVDPERAEQAFEWVKSQTGRDNVAWLKADVTSEADCAAAVKTAVETFGKLDICFANAGIVSRGGVPSVMGGEEIEFADLTAADWEHVCGVNLTGAIYTAKAAIPALRENGGGTILCTSSASAFAAYPNIALYMATKSGVNGLVRGLSFDLGRYGIRVNAVCPTHGMSPNFLMAPGEPVVGMSYEEANPEGWDPAISPIVLKKDRPPSLDDNVNVALFLASDEAAYVSGVCLPSADGGTLSRVAMQFEGIDFEAAEPVATE